MEPRNSTVGYDKNIVYEQETLLSLFLSIAVILVSLRFYVRTWIVKKLWWDDFFLLLGTLFGVASFGVAIAGIHAGLGQHHDALLPQQIYFAMKLEFIDILLALVAAMFTRTSICLFLLRIVTTSRVWRRAMYIILAVIVAVNLSTAIVLIPQCKPVAKWWNPTIDGTCWSQETELGMLYYQGGVSILTDIVLALLPGYFLKDVQISSRTKMSICALMSLGIFSGICAIIRTAQTPDLNFADITSSTKAFDTWAGLELHFAIIAAALPALRPLWVGRANQTHKRGQAGHPDHKQPSSRSYVMMDHPVAVFPCGLETHISAHGGLYHGDVGSKTAILPDRTGIMKTSDIRMSNFRRIEGDWVPEHSSLSDRERSAGDVA